jgi:type VI protein secretion system component Hcp
MVDEQNSQPEPVDPAMEDLDATVEDADGVVGGESLSFNFTKIKFDYKAQSDTGDAS